MTHVCAWCEKVCVCFAGYLAARWRGVRVWREKRAYASQGASRERGACACASQGACRCRVFRSFRQRSGRHSLAPCPRCQRGPHEPPTPLSPSFLSLLHSFLPLSHPRVRRLAVPGWSPPSSFLPPLGRRQAGPGALAGPNCAFRGTPCAAFQHVQGTASCVFRSSSA